MRFLLDESANFRIIPYLRRMGHDVATIAVDYPASLPDTEVLAIAERDDRVLITHDRHFGGLVFVDHRPHAGVILLRLGSQPPLDVILSRLTDVLTGHAHELDDFIVVTPDRIRVRRSAS